MSTNDHITAVEIIGSRLIALNDRNASRFRLIETSVAAPDFVKARTLRAVEPGALTGLPRASDALYVTRRDGAVSRLFRLPLAQGTGAAGAPREFYLPAAGSFETSGADPRLPGALLLLNGWTRGKGDGHSEGCSRRPPCGAAWRIQYPR